MLISTNQLASLTISNEEKTEHFASIIVLFSHSMPSIINRNSKLNATSIKIAPISSFPYD